MNDTISKLKGRSVLILAVLIAVYLTSHAPLILRSMRIGFDPSSGTSMEDRSIKIGDFTYYLHGALSIFDFEIEKKFNDKHMPILPQKRRISNGDMPSYAPYVLALYPYPSFKFGYSLTAALVTAPFPDALFQYKIHRLVFTNVILIGLTIILLFLITLRLTGSDVIAIFPCLFFIFDVSNAYNSYSYQSHTMCGLFYLLLSYYLFIRSKHITPLKLGVIAFMLVFSTFSSSHVIPLAVFMGLAIYAVSCYGEKKKTVLKYTVAAVVGSSIVPGYILGVEYLFDFGRLGLPTIVAQLDNYRNTMNIISGTFPVHLRFMWDLRVFNIFIVPILALTVLVYHLSKTKTPSVGEPAARAAVRWCRNNRDFSVLLFSLLTSTLITAFYMVPCSRAMTPYTVLYGVLLGMFLGRRYADGKWVEKVLVVLIVALLFFNFYITLKVIRWPEYRPSDNIIVINQTDVIRKNRKQFFETWRAGTHEYHIISKSIAGFIESYGPQIENEKTAYIRFDAMDLVNLYTSTRRFTPGFVPDKRDVVTSRTFLKDFRFIAEVFNLYAKGLIDDGDIIRKKVHAWNFRLWDQEYNYLYGYANCVRHFLKGTPLEQLNPHYIYYINYGAMKNAFLNNRGEEKVPLPEEPKEVFVEIFNDHEMSDDNWQDHQSPETNEFLSITGGQLDFRHIIDSEPSFGGIISTKGFPIEAGEEYRVSFKIKVVSGLVNLQIIEDCQGTPFYQSIGALKDPAWTMKEVRFIARRTSPDNKINFTNNSTYVMAEFYINDVSIHLIL